MLAGEKERKEEHCKPGALAALHPVPLRPLPAAVGGERKKGKDVEGQQFRCGDSRESRASGEISKVPLNCRLRASARAPRDSRGKKGRKKGGKSSPIAPKNSIVIAELYTKNRPTLKAEGSWGGKKRGEGKDRIRQRFPPRRRQSRELRPDRQGSATRLSIGLDPKRRKGKKKRGRKKKKGIRRIRAVDLRKRRRIEFTNAPHPPTLSPHHSSPKKGRKRGKEKRKSRRALPRLP